MARTLLDIPSFTWATDANRTITPATAGILPATGWDFSQRPPPRLMNYIHNLQGQSAQADAFKAIANYDIVTAYFGSSDVENIALRAATGLWLVVVKTSGDTYTSDTGGTTWASATSIGAAPNYATIITTDTDGFVLGAGSNIYHSTDASSWTSVGSFRPEYIANVGTSDYFLAAYNDDLEIWATGATGGGVSPSVISWGTNDIHGLSGDLGELNWMVVDHTGACHVSTDGGDNWAQSAEGPVDAAATFTPADLDYHAQTAVAVGKVSGTTPAIAYSLDDGATWSAATIHSPTLPAAGEFRTVRALGSQLWVAVGGWPFTRSPYWYSTDDGANWYPGCMRIHADDPSDVYHVWCTGGRVAACGGDGTLIFTDLVSAEF